MLLVTFSCFTAMVRQCQSVLPRAQTRTEFFKRRLTVAHVDHHLSNHVQGKSRSQSCLTLASSQELDAISGCFWDSGSRFYPQNLLSKLCMIGMVRRWQMFEIRVFFSQIDCSPELKSYMCPIYALPFLNVYLYYASCLYP